MAGLATGATALAGCLGAARDAVPGSDGTDGAGGDAGEGTGGAGPGLPVTVATLSAPGSTAGERRLPVPGRPTLLDLFATWCVPCQAQMEGLRTLHAEFGGDVAFVSVTNERFGGGLTAEDVRDWWRDHGGAWTVGHDPDGDLFAALRAGGLPYLALTDASGTVVWTHRGVASEDRLRTELGAVR
jgi:thiol-disulfide isomerase/thioredoxin